jgi:hypothetical protein
MKMEKGFALKKGVPLLLLGLFAFFLYIYFYVGIADIANTLFNLNPFYYLLAFVMFLLSMTFHSLTWWQLLKVLSVKTSFKKPILFTWVGSFVDILIPAEAVSGEVCRAYLMYKDSNENSGKIVASVVSHRILSIATTLGGMIGASAFFILKYKPSELIVGFILVVAIGTTLALFLLIYLSLKEKTTAKLVNWLLNLLKRVFKGRLKGTWLSSKARRTLKEFHKGIAILGEHPRKLVLPIAFSIMAWLFDVLIAFFVFSALDIYIPFIGIVVVYSISMAVQTIPLGIPGEVGIIEGVMIWLYTPFGIALADATAATILIRALTLWIKLVISGIAVQWIGIKILRERPD